MKKLRQLLMMAFLSMITLTMFGQASDLFFSEYAEGSSNNKYVEIYNGTGASVDLSNYNTHRISNGGEWDENIFPLEGILADGDVYIIANSSADSIILLEADITSTLTYYNGDDAVGLSKNDGLGGWTIIDVIGEDGPDPGSGWDVAGVTNATGEHTLVRKPDVCDPTNDWALSAGTNADDSQWVVFAQDYFDNIGVHISDCAGGQTVALPSFNPAAGTYISPINVVISCETPDASIYYTTDGSDPDESSTLYATPIPISETTTVKAKAYADEYNPSFVATAVYNFPATVSNLAQLRAGTIGSTYLVTGEVWLTFQQDYRGNKYFQDETAAILIDDLAGVITSTYEIGAGVVGLSGVLGEYGGMMQFVPESDPGNAVSSGNSPVPQVITPEELFSNFDEYEAELVQLNAVTFTDGGGTFANGIVYPLINGTDTTGNFRTTFYDMDYIGTVIPDFQIAFVGLPNSRTDGEYITSRNLSDFILGTLVETPTFNPEGGDFVAPIDVEISCATSSASIYFTTDGSDPDESSTLYVDPVNISETATLKAKAYADGIDPSLIAMAQYNFAEIQVLSPNGGEIWEQGETYEITWASVNFTGNVNVNITKPPFTNISLAPNIANTGSWAWTIPAAFATGAYKIKVTGVTPGDPFDSSDGTFTVSEPLPDPIIVINEIMYNPAGSLGVDDYFEYIELYNNSGFNVDLSGWSFAQGFTYVFDEGTILMDANYLVVARVPDSIIAHYGITNVVGPFSGALGNSGETVELVDANAVSIDIVTYDDGGDWPSEPDGNGPSLELMDPNFDNSLSESWAASLIDNGTPGMQNSVFGAELLTLVAPNGWETFEQGSSQEITWTYSGFDGDLMIKLIDVILEDTTTLATNVPVEYGLWDWEVAGNLTPGANYKIMIAEITDGEPMDESDAVFSVVELIIPVITLTSPNGGEAWAQGTAHEITWTSEFVESDVKIELNDGAKALTLIADSIAVANKTFTWDIPADLAAGDAYTIVISGMESGDPTDESDAVFSIIAPMPIPDLVINELMYDSPGYDNEWCEIYNREDVAVDLEGFYLLDSDDTHPPVTFPAGYSIQPGQYFTVSLELLALPLHFTPDFVGNAGWSLGNSGDDLRLFDPSGQLVNNVNFTDAAPWPTEPDGNGPTLSLLDPMLDNSLPENWAASTQDLGTPGAVNFGTVPEITVTAPNGGEAINQGTNFDITWNYVNFDGTVMIELMTAEKASSTLAYAPAADQTYVWEVTQDVAENYLIKISDSLTGEPMDESDVVFSIVPPAVLPDIVINEIMYNAPESGTDTLEFIELYNNGDIAVNLENWYFSQGVDLVFPSYELAPGAFVITAYSAEVMLNNFGVEAIEWTGGGLKNSGETIELLNDSGAQVDIVPFDDGGLWPNAPDEYGPSLALIDASSNNELPESWASETVFAFDHPVGIPVYASPEAANFSTPGQGILISSGWEGVSTYLSLNDPSVANNMDVVLNDLVVMQDFSSLYFPEYGINTIGNWNNDKGYQLKLNNTRYTVLYGEPATDKTVSLSAGWNGLPVLSSCDVETATLFGGINEIIFVKEMGGDGVYWPAGTWFTLDYLKPGKAYFIKVSGAVDITFPECAVKSSVETSHNTFINTTSWNDVSYTAASHTFGIDKNALTMFTEGDVIGVFTNDGLCAGMVNVSKTSVALMAWADDVYTNQLDGFAENSTLNFKMFVSSKGEAIDLIPTYDADYDSDGVYISHGISRILDFKAGTTGISETETSVSVYPNPTSGMLNITTNGKDFDHFEIYTAIGQKVFENNLVNDIQQINIKNLENGFYFIKFVSSASGVSKTINFIKN